MSKSSTESYSWLQIADFIDWHSALLTAWNKNRGKKDGNLEISESYLLRDARKDALLQKIPLAVFDKFRKEQLYSAIIELQENNQESSGSNVLCLARLYELSALRMWDLQNWRVAAKAHAAAYFSRTRGDLAHDASRALFYYVKGVDLTKSNQEKIFKEIVLRLDRGDRNLLIKLSRSLLSVYPAHEYRVHDFFEKFCDLVPEPCWESFAEWIVKFQKHTMDKRRMLGWKANPYMPLLYVIPSVSDRSRFWFVLSESINEHFKKGWLWGDREFMKIVEAWLVSAPLDVAKQSSIIMFSTDDSLEKDHKIYRARFSIHLCAIRPDLAKYSKEILLCKKELLDEESDILSGGEGDTNVNSDAAIAEIERCASLILSAQGGYRSSSIGIREAVYMRGWTISSSSERAVAAVDELIESIETGYANVEAQQELLYLFNICMEHLDSKILENYVKVLERWVMDFPMGTGASLLEGLRAINSNYDPDVEKLNNRALISGRLGQIVLTCLRLDPALFKELFLKWSGYLIKENDVSTFGMVLIGSTYLSSSDLADDHRAMSSVKYCFDVLMSPWGEAKGENALSSVLRYLADYKSSNGENELRAGVVMLAELITSHIAELYKLADCNSRESVALFLHYWEPLIIDFVDMELISQVKSDNRARVRYAIEAGFYTDKWVSNS